MEEEIVGVSSKRLSQRELDNSTRMSLSVGFQASIQRTEVIEFNYHTHVNICENFENRKLTGTSRYITQHETNKIEFR